MRQQPTHRVDRVGVPRRVTGGPVQLEGLAVVFFCSSRRRHTIWPRDWSSDVCSSDLTGLTSAVLLAVGAGGMSGWRTTLAVRSEERRVGKECRSRWSTCHEQKKK